jgi:small conductance mechanosensitive channel
MISSILAGAGVAGLAVGLALQGTLSNTFSGIFLSVKEILNVGDYIETNGYAGNVDEISLRHIKVREADNNFVFIPNKMVVDQPFKNYGLTPLIRTTITCGVGYESDLEKVRDVCIETIEKAFPPNDKTIEFHYLSFADSSINFQLRFWVPAKMQMSLLEAKSTAIMLIKKRFEKENINIPYPIRTLYASSQN